MDASQAIDWSRKMQSSVQSIIGADQRFLQKPMRRSHVRGCALTHSFRRRNQQIDVQAGSRSRIYECVQAELVDPAFQQRV